MANRPDFGPKGTMTCRPTEPLIIFSPMDTIPLPTMKLKKKHKIIRRRRAGKKKVECEGCLTNQPNQMAHACLGFDW